METKYGLNHTFEQIFIKIIWISSLSAHYGKRKTLEYPGFIELLVFFQDLA